MELIESVKNLYAEGLSVREVAGKLSVSMNSVYKLMRRKGIPRRSSAETNNFRYLRKAPSFKPSYVEFVHQAMLKTMGVALYWGEGAKRGWSIDFANSDPRMVKIFVKFLREICGVKESKLGLYLYCYPQHDVDELMNFWSKVTDIPREKFSKPYVRTDAKGKLGSKMKHGLIHVRYHDKKLVMQINKWIEECFEEILASGRGTQAAKEVAL
ncbi:MAG: hypothetical protein HY466_06195 [Deltaproteobacteria bacterium]|nr:hypothetical protein [Deltaproteobacteria bacterium]